MTPSQREKLIDRFAPMALLLALLAAALLTVYPFLPAIFWGIVLAMTIQPRYEWLVGKLRGRRLLAAWIATIVLLLVFIVPALGLARAILAFVPDALSWLERLSTAHTREPPAPLRDLPAIGPHLTEVWKDLTSDTAHAFTRFRDEIKEIFVWLLAEVEVLGVFVFEFALGILLAVVFVYSGDGLTQRLSRFFHRIGGSFADDLAKRAVITTRQTVRGVLGAAMIQTLVATISFIIVGVPNWMILAGLTFLLALTQIGPFLVFIPLAVFLWADGQTWAAAFVLAWGLIVVNSIDNVVKPYISSKDSDVPASIAFIGALGGLAEWGVLGVFLGPVVLAVCYEMVLHWIEREPAAPADVT